MSRHTTHIIDINALADALEAARWKHRMTWRGIAAATGVSPSCLTRLLRGAKPDVDALASLMAWAGVGFADITRPRDAMDAETGHENVV